MIDASKRLSNIEALRIIALVMIATVHITGGGITILDVNNFSWMFSNILLSFARFGVDTFVIIAAYFMCTKKITVGGIARRWVLLIYPLMVMIISYFILVNPRSIDEVNDVISKLAMGSFGTYHQIAAGHLWFIYPILFLIALSPLFNYAIAAMDQKAHKMVLGILIVLIILPASIQDFFMRGVFWSVNDPLFYFIALYFVAAYIRKYDYKINTKKAFFLWFICMVSIVIFCYLYSTFISNPSGNPNGAYVAFYDNNGLFVFSGAIFLFMGFRQLEFKNRAISILGKSTYDAYLIHMLVLYYVAFTWRKLPIEMVSTFDYCARLVYLISMTVGISLCYGLMRYGMDQGIKRLIKWSRLDKLGTRVAQQIQTSSRKLGIG